MHEEKIVIARFDFGGEIRSAYAENEGETPPPPPIDFRLGVTILQFHQARVIATSIDDAKNKIKARYPGCEIDWISVVGVQPYGDIWFEYLCHATKPFTRPMVIKDECAA